MFASSSHLAGQLVQLYTESHGNTAATFYVNQHVFLQRCPGVFCIHCNKQQQQNNPISSPQYMNH